MLCGYPLLLCFEYSHFFAAISLCIPWDYFDKLDTTRIERHHVRRLEQIGYTITLTPKENEAA